MWNLSYFHLNNWPSSKFSTNSDIRNFQTTLQGGLAYYMNFQNKMFQNRLGGGGGVEEIWQFSEKKEFF